MAIDCLLERLESIRTQASRNKEEQATLAQEISSRIAARDTALNAVASVSPPPPQNDIPLFSKGVKVEPRPSTIKFSGVPPLPAVKLLTEADPPEKLIHEQSIIVRAQAINRKNTELARERLPKQPEAQKSKTHHDYFLDEALWMATDFREERKWKIQMARKVSKFVLQYHVQRANRKARALAEERQRVLRLASMVARDVRKFWNQIGQIADYRLSLVEDAKRSEELEKHLEKLLQKTAKYTSIVGRSLVNGSTLPQQTHDMNSEEHHQGSAQDSLLQGAHANERPTPKESQDQQISTRAKSESDNSSEMSDTTDKEDMLTLARNDELDDESTLLAAEAEEQANENEVQQLQGEADMSVEDLLRSQGIDPETYKADKKCYLDENCNDLGGKLDTEKDDAAMEEGEEYVDSSDEDDDESTINAEERNHKQDKNEVSKLEAEASVNIADVLKSRGIDPSKYHGDSKSYTKSMIAMQVSTPDCIERQANGGVLHSPQGAELNGDRHGNPQTDVMENGADRLSGGLQGAGLSKGKGGNGRVKLPESSSPHDVVQCSLPDIPSTNVMEKDVTQAANTGRTIPEMPDVAVPSSTNGGTFQHPLQLLRGNLRPYQKAGMEWLASLYKQSLNGILADEMGLGKTIQTISLLAWLAVEKGIWGPHLIVVPTSVIVNWEVEFKKWLPGFKILTYFGSVKERKSKRQGWTKPNTFHTCITSYNLAVQDASALRRKKWVYLILDEAHNIKNFQSQRWQTLLTFPSQRRLLITGTPLQNSVMELWSLMHFLMPNVFESHSEFKEWFSKPLNDAAQAQSKGLDEKTRIVGKLHEVLRPFVLRRLKADVEKGLPPKHEHVVTCHLSKRQRQLYEDFVSRSDVRETLQSGDFLGVMNVLMQLRKVCNHPDLFEGRRILSPFAMPALFYPTPAIANGLLERIETVLTVVRMLNLNLIENEAMPFGNLRKEHKRGLSTLASLRSDLRSFGEKNMVSNSSNEFKSAALRSAKNRAASFNHSQLRRFAQMTGMFLRRRALLGNDLVDAFTMSPSSLRGRLRSQLSSTLVLPSVTPKLVQTIEQLTDDFRPRGEKFICCITKAVAPAMEFRFRGDDYSQQLNRMMFSRFRRASSAYQHLFRPFEIRRRITSPDTRLIQWDCGKLQVLDSLLRSLRRRGSRALIFTQMTKVLDILEAFLNLHSVRYLRLDGTTKTDDRQKVVERFNTDRRIFCMILTTRAGGIGLNLTGADSVIFYDTDYNPAIDNQAQDRVHRIGQTRPVHIYRLVCERTVEENILRRARQKRALESMVITDAGFTPEAIASHQRDVVADILPTSNVRSSLLPGQQHNAPGDIGSDQVSNPAGATRKNFGLLEYQDVTARLLADEDDRERIAVSAAEQERKEMEAEFRDTPSSQIPESVNVENGLREDKDDVVSELTPVQRYALRLVENWRSLESEEPERKASLVWEEEFSVHRMLERRDDLEQSQKFADSIVVAAEFKSQKQTSLSEPLDNTEQVSGDDRDEPVTYELDISEEGNDTRLKALTDTDADIKLYLPLRDGGPDELKASTVVSGTAAAGLESAEDAAFFPHAYARMSRTVYATKGQQEKARTTMLRRKAEKEARRRREETLAAAAIERERQSQAAVVQGSRTSQPFERQKLGKQKADAGRAATQSSVKKARSGGTIKNKSSSSVGKLSGMDSASLSTHGLFKRTTKKATKRLISTGRSPLSGGGTGMNDGWTMEEDRLLLTLNNNCNENMALLSDMMRLRPGVSGGVRKARGPKHCYDRLSAIQREAKDGSYLPKSTDKERDVYKSHMKALAVAMEMARKSPPDWLPLPINPSGERHDSQVKTISGTAGKSRGKFRANYAPIFPVVAPSITLPSHFRPGFKSTETTPEALNRKRFPFLRPPRDEARLAAQRAAALSRQSTMHQNAVSSNVLSQTVRHQNYTASQSGGSSAPSRLVKHGRGQGLNGRTSGTMRANNMSGLLTTSQKVRTSSQMATSLHAKPPQANSVKKGQIPAVSGSRMMIGPVGSGIQKIGRPGVVTPVIDGRKPPKVAMKTPGQVKSAKMSAPATPAAALLNSARSTGNGIVRPLNVKVQAKSTGAVITPSGPRVSSNAQVGKSVVKASAKFVTKPTPKAVPKAVGKAITQLPKQVTNVNTKPTIKTASKVVHHPGGQQGAKPVTKSHQTVKPAGKPPGANFGNAQARPTTSSGKPAASSMVKPVVKSTVTQAMRPVEKATITKSGVQNVVSPVVTPGPAIKPVMKAAAREDTKPSKPTAEVVSKLDSKPKAAPVLTSSAAEKRNAQTFRIAPSMVKPITKSAVKLTTKPPGGSTVKTVTPDPTVASLYANNASPSKGPPHATSKEQSTADGLVESKQAIGKPTPQAPTTPIVTRCSSGSDSPKIKRAVNGDVQKGLDVGVDGALSIREVASKDTCDGAKNGNVSSSGEGSAAAGIKGQQNDKKVQKESESGGANVGEK